MRMSYWGKIIGGILGYTVAGPFGAILGVFFGHVFDKGLKNPLNMGFGAQLSTAQQAFFRTTFLVMGHIAKADGVISNNEIQMARLIMDKMGLSQARKLEAMHLFNEGKASSFNVDAALDTLSKDCHAQKLLLRMFIEIQVQAAFADGQLSEAEKQILRHMCQQLGFAAVDFQHFEDSFRAQYQRQHSGAQAASPKRSLQQAYVILGVPQTASDADVKRAYRKLMSQHHPDKLASKGLPEDMMKLATERTQEIKSAYEQIKSSR